MARTKQIARKSTGGKAPSFSQKFFTCKYFSDGSSSDDDDSSQGDKREIDPNQIAKKIELIATNEEVSSESSLVCQKHPPAKYPKHSVFVKYQAAKDNWKDWVYVGADGEFSKVEPDEIDDGFLDDMDYTDSYLKLCSDDKDEFDRIVKALKPKVEKGDYVFSDSVIEEIINYRGDKYLLVDQKAVIGECDHTKRACYGNHILHIVVQKEHYLNSLAAHVIEYLDKYSTH